MRAFARLSLPLLVSVASLGYVMSRGMSTAPIAVFLGTLVFFCYVVLTSGAILLRVVGMSDRIVASWPLGVAATGVVLWPLTTTFGVTAAAAFALWGALVAGLHAAILLRAGAPASGQLKEIAALALCGVFTVAWCRGIAAAPEEFARTGTLPAWIDYFLHAGLIAQFSDARALGHDGIWLPGIPRIFYHYASYVLPAAFATPLSEPGLTLATSVWLPVGMLSMACGAYTLGASLAGPTGGIAALIGLFVIPDASNYWLRNGFFSFHWNLLASPGAAYALAAALLSVAFLQRWSETRITRFLIASGALAAATILFRAQVFVLLFPVWIAVVAIESPFVRRKWLWFFAGGALAGIIAIVTYQSFGGFGGDGRTWVIDEGQALERFLSQVHTRQEPTAYTDLYVKVLRQYGDTVGHAFGMALVYPAALGAFLLLLPLAFLLARDRLRPPGIDALPAAALVIYAALMILAPTPAHQDATDLIHRPFVLLYALVVIWSVVLCVRWICARTQGPERAWTTSMQVSLLAIPFVWLAAPEMSRPKFEWGKPLAEHRVDRGVIAAGAFLYAETRPGEIFAVGRLPHRYAHVDDAAVLVALSSTPVYLGRTWTHLIMEHSRAELARGRYNALLAIEFASDRNTAFRYLREIGVRWYVATDLGTPAWDPSHGSAIYTSGKVAIYDAR